MPKVSAEARILMMNTLRRREQETTLDSEKYKFRRMLDFHEKKLTEIINAYSISATEREVLADEYNQYMTPAQEEEYFVLRDQEEKGGPLLQ